VVKIAELVQMCHGCSFMLIRPPISRRSAQPRPGTQPAPVDFKPIVRLVSLILILCTFTSSLLAEDRAAVEDVSATSPAAIPTLQSEPDALAAGSGEARPSPLETTLTRIPLPPLRPTASDARRDLLPERAKPQPGISEPDEPLPLVPPSDSATEGAVADDAIRIELTPHALDIPDAWDERLHANLPWEFCGPGSGGVGLGDSPLPEATPGVPVTIVADRVDYNRNTEVIDLRGGVEVTQAEQRLEADRSTYDRRSGDLQATGDVFLDSPGLRIQGDRADFNLVTKEGRIGMARYRLSGGANLLGTAEEAEILPDGLSRYRNITYTTCPPGNADWSVRARDLKLDQEDGMGYARHARIRVGTVPVLYTPYLFFPIDDRRRSGFLIPSFGSSDATGTDVSIPYYWNIAPNMDATITPRLMSTRGLMLGTQLRHLTGFQEMEVNAQVLPEDRRARDEGMRGAVRVLQRGQLGPGWSSSVDFASVSDDRFLQDFGNQLDSTSLRNLGQRGDVSYAGDGWRMLTRVQQFQTIDPAIPAANRPYGQMPHVELDLYPQRWENLLEYSLDGQYDFFDHGSKVHGSRLVAVPSLRMPLRRAFGYIVPQARLYVSGYDLTDVSPGQPARQTYIIPSLDLDSALVFERETNWFSSEALQTLEPRLYYVLTSFEDQSNVPLFDTTLLDFSFASLFRPNRFTGYDRIGDENRVTLGLTSRTIANQSGRELFRASVGQIYYFQDRQVQLIGQPADDQLRSSVAGELAASLSETWSARASAQWNPSDAEQSWEKRVLQVRYASDEGRLLNLAYRFNFPDQELLRYEDTEVSFAMPVGSEVRVVGRWLYSILSEETLEAFAGIEFGRCCWKLRLLGQHLQTAGQDSGNTSVMLQIELAGLGSFGNQIDTLLERGIYGYHTD
jgi:LPS-assembly protein